jgi:hypothetical protein
MPHELDEIGPAIAKWLAPFIASELSLVVPSNEVPLSPDYDSLTAQVYVRGLGDQVLPRAEKLFGWLMLVTDDGEGVRAPKTITSAQLTRLLVLKSPREIAGVLTNSLKKRAKRLGLPNPWIQEETRDHRTLWRCHDADQAERLFEATQAELKRRGLPVSLAED